MRTKHKVDNHAELGQAVMQYLGTQRPAKRLPSRDKNTEAEEHADHREDNRLFNWRKGSDSDKTPAPKQHSDHVPALRVSPLLSKQAKGFMSDPIHKTIEGWRDTMKSPIVSSLALGLPLAATYWIADKFVNPDSVGSNENVARDAEKLIDEAVASGNPGTDSKVYIDQAIANNQRRRWKNAALALLGSAALLHTRRIDPNNWSKLYKYSSAMPKRASMLGPDDIVPFSTIRDAVQFDSRMSPSIKHSALNALSYNPSPYMSSTDIVSNAIYSGESAKTGLPIGRLISAAVADAAVGYGAGKLLGVGSPARVAGLAGIGSALINAISYNNKL